MKPIYLEQAMELALRVEDRNKVNSGKKSGFGIYRTGQYSSVSFQSNSPGKSTNYSLQSSPNSIRSWASQAEESQGSLSSPKSFLNSSTVKSGGEMPRLIDKELQEKRAKDYVLGVMRNGQWGINVKNGSSPY